MKYTHGTQVSYTKYKVFLEIEYMFKADGKTSANQQDKSHTEERLQILLGKQI